MENDRTSLGVLRGRVQSLVDRKSDYIKVAIYKTLSTEDMQNVFRVSTEYKNVVDQNGLLHDLMRDIKDEQLFLGFVLEKLDTTTQLGQQQYKQVEGLNKILKSLMGILEIEERKMDRLIRFYERTSNYFTTF